MKVKSTTKKPASAAAAVIRKALDGPVDADLLVEATKYGLHLLVESLGEMPIIQKIIKPAYAEGMKIREIPRRSPEYLNTGRAMWLANARQCAAQLADAIDAGDVVGSVRLAVETMVWIAQADPKRQMGLVDMVDEARDYSDPDKTRTAVAEWRKLIPDAVKLGNRKNAVIFLMENGAPEKKAYEAVMLFFPKDKRGRKPRA